MNKQCKQCMRVMPDDPQYFKPYPKRGQGIRNTQVGSRLYCRDCDRLNRTATRIWKQEDKTEQELEFLRVTAEHYKKLCSIGGHPTGSYASFVLGGEQAPRRSLLDTLMAGMQETVDLTSSPSTTTVAGKRDMFMAVHKDLMAACFDDLGPEQVEELIENWHRSIPEDRRGEYRDQYLELLGKQDEYTDRLDEKERRS